MTRNDLCCDYLWDLGFRHSAASPNHIGAWVVRSSRPTTRINCHRSRRLRSPLGSRPWEVINQVNAGVARGGDRDHRVASRWHEGDEHRATPATRSATGAPETTLHLAPGQLGRKDGSAGRM